ncbi:enoyl-CoA hydratase-related protein [Alicyclobacillus sp. ALC3]|uniref:enoyl-CoA hydratase-related protein n=1 Tax=Alicyclobacillus sp. ALC3 TaxID=2796143 RepID=UPI002378BC34|nr:enoyl-CoA hydratase-related protein [Alicyclobacillus sp. ALC3]WDL95567.1 enoyl-CoA hydratase/isomerase family protein [Alicyclobacillus sp. ALC3]
MYEMVTYEVREGVALITLNRPQVANAINTSLGQELYSAMKRVENEPGTRAVVLTGAGRAFCAGQDLSEQDAIADGAHLANAVRERYNLLIAKMQALPVPIIAAVNGAAAGAGFGLALACDLRFAATNAKFTMAFSRIGLAPDSGTSYFLPRLIGVGKALEWAWTADVISAESAHAAGVVNRLFEPEALLEETLRFAAQLAAGPTKALALTKETIYQNFSASLPEALEREAVCQEQAGQSADFIEGVTAFVQKRAPKYEGR